jgi:hypothetical protein
MQLSLPSVPLEGLIDVLNFTAHESVALAEFFAAPLRIILMDSHTTTRIQSDIPKYTSFMHRFTASEVAYFAVNKDSTMPVPASDNIVGLVNALGPASADVDFDCQYNGLQLLPRRLQARMADPLRWQSVLRCVLMRLEPVFAIQRCCRSIPPEILHQLFSERLLGHSTAGMKRSASLSRLASSISSPVPAAKSFPGTVRSPMARSQGLTPARTRKGVAVNRDILLNVTENHINKIAIICDACRQLETNEMHTLPVQYKVAILKALCDACYETSYFRHLLESNAEERANSITNMNKLVKERQSRLKDVSASKREAAIAACREINIAAAQGKKSKKKPESKKDSKDSKGDAKGAKGGKVKDEFEPSFTQLNAMLEDMMLLESVKVDKCVEDVPLDPPEDLDDFGDDLAVTRHASKSGRTKEAERSRMLREYQYKLEQVEQAKALLADAIESGIEKEIRRAIKAAERAGLRWKDDDDVVYCTELLKQVRFPV